MPPTIPRPLPPDAIARLRSVDEVCDALLGWGQTDLADCVADFASDEGLADGDVPLTLESALGFLAFFRRGRIGGGQSGYGLFAGGVDLRRLALS